MTRDNLRIVAYRPEHRSQVTRLQKLLWSRSERLNSRYFAWKYEHNPYLPDPFIFLALHNEVVVGMRGLFGAPWVRGNRTEPIPMLCAGDLVIAPAYRSRWLFTRIMRAAEEAAQARGHRYLVNLSAGPATYLQSLRMGWTFISGYEPVAKPAQGRPTAARIHDRARRMPVLWRFSEPLGDVLLTAAVRFGGFDRHARTAGAAANAVRGADQGDAEAMAALVAETGGGDAVRQARDAAYYRWRLACPLSSYRFVYHRDGSRLRGFLVLQSRVRTTADHVAIVDWQAADPGVWSDMVGFAARAVAPLGLTLWSSCLPEPYVAALAASGFSRRDDTRDIKRYRPGLLLRDLDAGRPPAVSDPAVGNDAAGWDLRMIFSDSY